MGTRLIWTKVLENRTVEILVCTMKFIVSFPLLVLFFLIYAIVLSLVFRKEAEYDGNPNI